MSNKSFKFTDKNVKDIKPTDKREYYHDTIVKDLLLQVTPNGAKTFYLYKKINGRPVRYKLGKTDIGVKYARNEALKYRMLVNNGENPQETRKNIRNEDSVEKIYKKYMLEHRLKLAKSTYDSYKRIWDIHLKKYFGSKKVSEVSIESVRRFHRRLSATPYVANKSVVLLKAMYNYVIKEGYYKGDNPATSVVMNKEEPRIRYLERHELERFFEVINDIPESISKYAILMMLFTGARKGNVLRMKWSEIDLDAKIWKIPKTKTDKNVTIALADSAVELLNQLKSKNPESEFVFPSAESKSGHLFDAKRVWSTIKKRTGLNDLRQHDLRHTLATYMVSVGTNPYIIQRALTHKDPKSTQIYVNLGVEDLREKLNETINTIEKIGKRKKKGE